MRSKNRRLLSAAMKDVNCNNCKANTTSPINNGPDLLLGQPGDFHLVRCLNCGLIYQNPQLTIEELARHYPNEYLPYKKEINSEKSFTKRIAAQHGLMRRCNQLIKHRPMTGKLLDVGCSTGLFLNAMRESGWDVEGVELNQYAVEYARKTFGLTIYQGTLEEVNFPDASFDVITLWDVLEHVHNPRITLSEIARILKPGGLLALSLPNPHSLEARLFGKYWVGWDRPRHLHIFPPPVLENYLTNAGMEIKTIESLGGRLGLTLLSIEFFCKAHHLPEYIWQTISWISYNWPLRVLTWPAYRLIETLNLSTNMTVFANRAAA